ncbi:MAG: C1 family peptidase [Chitinophagales bacterium]
MLKLNNIITLILLFCCLKCLQAQTHTGLILDESKYSRVPLTATYTTKSYNKLPYKVSLKDYCPTAGDQYNTGTCVGWAVAYGARTIIEAMNNNWTTKASLKKINANTFSPSFIYNAVLAAEGRENDCMLGAHISDALQIMTNKGALKLADFPFDANCEVLVEEEHHIKAKKNRILGYHRLSFTQKDNAKVNRVRQSLANNYPVILGIKILDNFKNIKHENHTWNPELGNPNLSNIHAMLVVGYDDLEQRFELMNSWGTTWNNEGFIYVSYEDFNKYAKEAYEVLHEVPQAISDNIVNIAAHVDFAELAMQREADGDLECTAEQIGLMTVEGKQNYYSMVQEHYTSYGYQIYLNPEMQNMSVYLFSIDNTNKIELLYPFSEDFLSLYGQDADNMVVALTPYVAGTIAIPHEDYCMQLNTNIGTINCFLFSKKPIEIDALLKKIQNSKGSLQERIDAALGKQKSNIDNIKFNPHRVSFEGNIANNEIVPIIVDVNHVK